MTTAALSTNLAFDEPTHTYTCGERKLTSVTTILRNFRLYPSYDFLATSNKIADPGKYKNLGTAVHSACHLHDVSALGYYAPLVEEVAGRLENYKRFLSDTGFKPRIWELPLADPDRDVAGMLDSMGERGDEIWLTDIKTGTVPVGGVGPQLAAYFDLVTNRGRLMTKSVPVDTWIPPVDIEWFEQVRRQWKRIRRVSVNLTMKNYTVRTHEESKWAREWEACVTLHNAWKERGL